MDVINRFNYWLMSALANANATAWAFYLLLFAVLKALTYQHPTDTIGWINYIVQTLYQGTALPLISFVAKLEGEKQSRKIDETHEASMAMQAEAQQERQYMLAVLEEIRAIRKDEDADNQMMRAIMAKLDLTIDDACDEVLP